MIMNFSLERYFSAFFALFSLFALTVECYDTISSDGNYSNNKEWFKIEGKVHAPDVWAKVNPNWKLNTEVLIDGGEYRAYLRFVNNFKIISFT